ncbi:MAG TPA: DUF3311 domain-containing protein [Pseudonocardia sp.]|uniref:DUF3311 domain-containing protein n=1 Tax=Pseudonocardia sp. TaxID=60912 RepID=UPI002B9AC6AE|nr:DUF3311 domain-containing protein [Pseudonocardia sp.]HTF49249.1 DUF3311 domain-containing protein [Pseudonocardia sp.]
MSKKRTSLWWLLGPPVAFLGVLPIANRVEPIVLGLPFLMFWLFVAVLLTPLFVWLAAKGDPVWMAAREAERAERTGRAQADTRGGG